MSSKYLCRKFPPQPAGRLYNLFLCFTPWTGCNMYTDHRDLLPSDTRFHSHERVLRVLVVLFVSGAGQWWHITTSHLSRWGNGQLTALWTLLLPTLLPGQSRFSNVNIGVNIGEKVEGTITSYDPDHKDKQDHLCFYLCICLNMGGNTKAANVEGLNTGCSPGHVDILLASC